jgi:nucleoside-diphosphate-sugar epimerase
MAGRLAAVTGATGFLGRYIVRDLTAAGWQVRVLARKTPTGAPFSDPMIDAVAGDLSNCQALRELVDGADVVVHAAGLIKAPNAAAFHAVNVDGTANLVNALNDCRSAKHLLLVSSMVAREPQLSAYAATKRASEEVVATALQKRLHDWTTVRPCAVYGPSDTETLTIFRAAAHRIFPLPGPRKGRVGLIHAADAARAIVSLCNRGVRGNFELTDQRVEGYLWPEIVAALEASLGRTVFTLPLPGSLVRAAAALNTLAAKLGGRTPVFTVGKAREILHSDWGSSADRLPPPQVWQPEITLGDGFHDTVCWYRARNWLPPGPSKPLSTGVAR